jgi:hypothetical protein|nr:MAG TPA: hypothetical protein [Caudoviricetes sp.]
MYRPKVNLHNLDSDFSTYLDFEYHAEIEANARFKDGLVGEGFSSVEHMQHTLSQESEGELRTRLSLAEEQADDLRQKAVQPNISPEDSFDALVEALVLEEYMIMIERILEDKQVAAGLEINKG